MKKNLLVIALALVIPFTFTMAFAGNLDTGGTLSGSHYNLNLIAKEDCKSADMMGSNRHTIFVLLESHPPAPTDPTPIIGTLDRQNRIFLEEGPFEVVDGNACDGATFKLPKNECDVMSVEEVSGCDYDVYIRGLGSPKNNPYALMTTCRVDTSVTPNVLQCSTETVRVERNKGKSSFTNVTKDLTTLCLDTVVDATKKCDTRVGLFTEEFYDYFWNYDNNGLRLAQLRFYPRLP